MKPKWTTSGLYLGKKSEQRWLWYAIDHVTSTILAYVIGKRKDEVFKQLKALLQPLNIIRYHTDDWSAYEHHTILSNIRLASEILRKLNEKN